MSSRGRAQRAALALGRVGQAGPDVVKGELWKIGQNLFRGHAPGQVPQYIADGNTSAPYTRLAESDGRIRDDSLEPLHDRSLS
jgi:hypothetical protein